MSGGYIQSITLSGGALPFKGKTAAKEYFAGSKVESTNHLYDTAADAVGVDTKNKKGMFRLRYDAHIRCVQPIAIPKATDVTFTFYESDDNSAFTKGASFTTKIAKLNEARREFISFPLPSTTARYLVMSIQFSGGSASTSDAITAGSLLISVEPSSY